MWKSRQFPGAVCYSLNEARLVISRRITSTNCLAKAKRCSASCSETPVVSRDGRCARGLQDDRCGCYTAPVRISRSGNHNVTPRSRCNISAAQMAHKWRRFATSGNRLLRGIRERRRAKAFPNCTQRRRRRQLERTEQESVLPINSAGCTLHPPQSESKLAVLHTTSTSKSTTFWSVNGHVGPHPAIPQETGVMLVRGRQSALAPHYATGSSQCDDGHAG